MPKLSVQIWSDIACPWCYVGKRHFETALSQFAGSEAVEVRFRSFELDPSAPSRQTSEHSYTQRLAAKYGTGIQAAQGMIDAMTTRGADKGIEFRFDRIQGGNTFLAHQLLQWAATETVAESNETITGLGAQPALKERLMLAYFSEGIAIGDPAELVRLAGTIGLDEERAHNALTSGSFSQEVRKDEELANQSGISGVPFFAIGRYGISGAQPADSLADALRQAWSEQSVAS